MATKIRASTETAFRAPIRGLLPRFEIRNLKVVRHLSQKYTKTYNTMDLDRVKEELERRLALLVQKKEDERQARKAQLAKRKPEVDESLSSLGLSSSGSLRWSARSLPRDDYINFKRREIERVLDSQAQTNLKEAARRTKTTFAMVKKVYHDMQRLGHPEVYSYNNLKTQEELSVLHKTIQDITHGFETVSMLKRKHPGFSRKRLLRELRGTGYRWRPVRRERKVPEFPPPNPTHVLEAISHLTQVLCDDSAEMLYIDEMKFPLRQNASYHWVQPGQPDAIVYSRRPVQERSLTAVALCSCRGFVAVQLFEGEIRARELLYFLHEAIQRLPTDKTYSIFADNATWHTAEFIEKSPASKFLYFNVPHMFQINLIENAFSFIRDGFRRRPLVSCVEEEAELILGLFFHQDNERRFKGVLRNHFRMLLKYLEINRNK